MGGRARVVYVWSTNTIFRLYLNGFQRALFGRADELRVMVCGGGINILGAFSAKRQPGRPSWRPVFVVRLRAPQRRKVFRDRHPIEFSSTCPLVRQPNACGTLPGRAPCMVEACTDHLQGSHCQTSSPAQLGQRFPQTNTGSLVAILIDEDNSGRLQRSLNAA